MVRHTLSCLDSCNNFVLAFEFVRRFFSLALVALSLVALAFAPFIIEWNGSNDAQSTSGSAVMVQHLKQILGRLFPFERGLTHAYWAPNFWALYNSMDKVASLVLRRRGQATASLTGGLVGLDQGAHLVLPSITPRMTIALSLCTSTLVRLAFPTFLTQVAVTSHCEKVRQQETTGIVGQCHSLFILLLLVWLACS